MNYKLKILKSLLLLLSNLFFVPASAFSQDHQDWSYNLGIYEVNVRQYTEAGNFDAFSTHLDRLNELGVGILWFMPIHPIGQKNRLGSLGSYYSVKDYLAVNPEFGTLEEFIALVEQIHQMGMYVIIDWVANHTAWDNPLTITNPDWYSKDNEGNFIPPPGTNWSDVIDLDYSKQGLREYMIDAMKFWITDADVDGFRCDAASMVPLDFWETAINELKSIKPELLMLAEADGTEYQDAGFDMTFAWGLYGFGNGVLPKIYNGTYTANNLRSYIYKEQNNFSEDHYRMYFTSNHDENSWHGTVYELFGDAVEIFAVITHTINGMPLIYSGQEAGLNKRLLFFDKDEINWQYDPFAEIYSTLLKLKKDNNVLWNGNNGGITERVLTSNNPDIYAFVREKDDDKIFVILNLTNEQQNFTFEGDSHIDSYVNVFTSDSTTFSGEEDIDLPSWGYLIYEKGGSLTDVAKNKNVPVKFSLSQNYPNPFNSNTNIQFILPEVAYVEITIFNNLGQKVKNLLSDYIQTGSHIISWNGKDETGINAVSGIYFYQLSADNVNIVKKVILLR
ncbi:alpha-amylase family glycosyl hydrolase [Bacteroidota bacterium]